MKETRDDDRVPGWPNWIGLVVEDLEAQRRFYAGAFGLEVVDSGEGWVQFEVERLKLFELLKRSDRPQYDRSGFQPGFSVGDIRGARDRLIERGAEPISEIEGGPEHGGYWCYFRDPEGNRFEISQQVPPDPPGDP